MTIEPVGDHDAVGNGRGTAGHGKCQDDEEEIKLPEASGHP